MTTAFQDIPLAFQVDILAFQIDVSGAAVWPDPSQVALGVVYGPTGIEYTGTMVCGSGGAVWMRAR